MESTPKHQDIPHTLSEIENKLESLKTEVYKILDAPPPKPKEEKKEEEKKEEEPAKEEPAADQKADEEMKDE